MLKVRVAAAAADGAANAAVLALLAKALHVPKSSLTLVAGQTARLKRVAVEGLDAAALTAAFGSPPAPEGFQTGVRNLSTGRRF